jgi:hypothetical protein
VTTEHVNNNYSQPAKTTAGAGFRARNAKTPQLQVNAGNLHAFTGARSASSSNATGRQNSGAVL